MKPRRTPSRTKSASTTPIARSIAPNGPAEKARSGSRKWTARVDGTACKPNEYDWRWLTQEVVALEAEAAGVALVQGQAAVGGEPVVQLVQRRECFGRIGEHPDAARGAEE